MAKKRGRKRKQKGALSSETKGSIWGVVFLLAAALVMLSFTGQGEFLQAINNFLSYYLGLVTLLVPFLLIAAALVLFKTEAVWSKPNVLIGGVVLTLGIMLISKSGSLGGGLFGNFAKLISTPGVYILSVAVIVAGGLIIFQASVKELHQKYQVWSEERAAAALEAEEEAEKEAEEHALLVNNEGEEIDPSQTDFVDHGEPLALGGGEAGGLLGKLKNKLGKKGGAGVGPGKVEELDIEMAEAEVEMESDEIPNIMTKKAVTGESWEKLEILGQNGEEIGEGEVSEEANMDETVDNSGLIWEYPKLDILSESEGGEADRGDVRAMAQTIQDTLDSFGIKAKVAEVNRGPSVTQYALEIAMGTKISKITSLSNNLALALAAPNGQIRIEAPIAGKSLVGIEVPNQKAAYVTLRQMLAQQVMEQSQNKLLVALGIDVTGNPITGDIAKMPHALIAGATGSGKSVGINSFLCSILFRAAPNEVKLILVDPKRVEMTPYNDIPHLLTPVIYDAQKVVSALKWLTVEMDSRYKHLAEAGVRNIAAYNEQAGFIAMPQIVLIVDEFADIMMYAPSEVEESITRIAQMARAVGIHMILSTQRPSVNVITGLIKANIPTRISFNVTSVMDSRVVLDAPGAEKLLGNGDMLFIPPDKAKPTRIQGTYVSDGDIAALTGFLKGQGWRPEYLEDVTSKFSGVPAGKKGAGAGAGGEVGGGGSEDRDPLFDEALKFFSQQDVASSSSLQRRLSVGYARAARILDQVYEAGFVGAANASKPREVYRDKIMQYMASGE